MKSSLFALALFASSVLAQQPRSISGIYPSLAMFNNEGECGTGAVVPWADRLWVITYGPHLPFGSSDKLYEITPELKQIVRPESVGGTPANRMIHTESQQLFIGPYVVDAKGGVRVIPPSKMPGRLTGNARHLTDPAGKIYYATMEEGLYEVDVKSLAVTNHILDGNDIKKGFKVETPLSKLSSELPGYHGKGLYSSQGRLIYANNGDRDKRVLTDPTTPSGALGEWRKPGEDWQLVRRNQFTEVTGPGGIHGSDPQAPVWSIGWDAKSLILMLLDGGKWSSFRLPKVSHSYDGAHGWNTEWPRIRDIGEKDLLMTMHGAFWRFPKTFSAANTNGIRVRSAYMKVIGDFARWNDKVVFGCDDSAKSEFLNKRSVKGHIDSVGQSNSNLWFTDPALIDKLGPAHASGALWLHETVKEGDQTEPFLVAGWQHRTAWVINHGQGRAQLLITSSSEKVVDVPAKSAVHLEIASDAEWLKAQSLMNTAEISLIVTLTNGDARSTQPDAIFDGVATADSAIGGVFRARGENKRTLALAAQNVSATGIADIGYYELDAELDLKRVEDKQAHTFVKTKVAVPKEVITIDDASVLIVDDRGRRWRLPVAERSLAAPTQAGLMRVCREVATERDMLNACGTFYELPAENADGFAKIRPIASHNLRVMDFGSHRGLLLMSGVNADAKGEHILRSDDGKAALWAGVIDDLWKLGKPRGLGGPWNDTVVQADQKSDPYLIWGYDQRTLKLSHDDPEDVSFKVELDLTGTGEWVTYLTKPVPAGETATIEFEPAMQARWLRVTANEACTATAQLEYR